MDREFELEMTDLLLDLTADPSAGMVESIYEVPADSYVDPARFARERERIFGELPLMAALSPELPEPGSWKLFDEAGVPIVLVRGDDGVVRGFLNICGHRGARLVEEARGQSRRLSCPFHGWSYKPDGTLGGVPAKRAFEGMCWENRALHPVPTREQAGVIWVVPRGSGELDLSSFLGPFAAEIERWDMGSWHYAETRVHEIAANWKITMDTYTEGYHIPVVHRNSLVPMGATGTNRYDQIGLHHRQMFPMGRFDELRDMPREQRRGFDEWRFAFTYVVYPNTTFLIAGDHTEMYQTFPGPTVDSSRVVQTFFTFQPLVTDEDRANYKVFFDFFYNLLRTEDFRIAAGIQRGLTSRPYDRFVLGRLEGMTQAMHRQYQRDLDAAPTEPVRAPLAAAGS